MQTLLSTLALLSVLLCNLSAQTQPGSSTLDPAFTEQFAKGKEALKSRRSDEALSAFKKANKLQNEMCGECAFGMALAYSQKSDTHHAMEFADKAIALAKDDVARALAYNLKGKVNLALAESDSKKLKDAEDEFRQAVQLNKSSALYHFSLGKALAMESKDDEAKQELQSCLDLKPEEPTAREARMILANPRRASAEFAPDFQLTTLQGQEFSLAKASGRVLVLDFWATWCPPCRESVGELQTLTKKYRTEKLVLVSVSADEDDSAWREFVGKKKMDWMQYRDSDQKILHAFGIHAFPTYLVITGDGIVKQRIVGMNPRESIVHRLKETLASMPELEGELPK